MLDSYGAAEPLPLGKRKMFSEVVFWLPRREHDGVILRSGPGLVCVFVGASFGGGPSVRAPALSQVPPTTCSLKRNGAGRRPRPFSQDS